MRRAIVMTLAGLLLAAGAGAAAVAADPLTAAVQVNGAALPGGQAAFTPEEPVRIALKVTNSGSEPVTVSTVRLGGAALGVRLFEVETAVAIEVPPGATVAQQLTVDVGAVRRAATGRVDLEAVLLDDSGEVLAAQSASGFIDGSTMSTWGLFSVGAILLAALSGTFVGFAARSGRLPAGSAFRAAALTPLGVVLGLAVVAMLSLFGLAAPTWWLVAALGAATAAAGAVTARRAG